MTGRNIPNFVLKRILRYFLKTSPDKILSKNSKIYIVLKRMLELFLKVPPLKKLEFQNQKKDYEICTKRKSQTKNQTNN